MAILTTYTCDKCGHSQTDGEQMWQISVHLRHSTYGAFDYSYPDKNLTRLWCRKCVQEVQLLPPPKKVEPAVPAPTFEELVREICRDEIASAS